MDDIGEEDTILDPLRNIVLADIRDKHKKRLEEIFYPSWVSRSGSVSKIRPDNRERIEDPQRGIPHQHIRRTRW